MLKIAPGVLNIRPEKGQVRGHDAVTLNGMEASIRSKADCRSVVTMTILSLSATR